MAFARRLPIGGKTDRIRSLEASTTNEPFGKSPSNLLELTV